MVTNKIRVKKTVMDYLTLIINHMISVLDDWLDDPGMDRQMSDLPIDLLDDIEKYYTNEFVGGNGKRAAEWWLTNGPGMDEAIRRINSHDEFIETDVDFDDPISVMLRFVWITGTDILMECDTYSDNREQCLDYKLVRSLITDLEKHRDESIQSN